VWADLLGMDTHNFDDCGNFYFHLPNFYKKVEEISKLTTFSKKCKSFSVDIFYNTLIFMYSKINTGKLHILFYFIDIKPAPKIYK
jgi:hypothetical protein